MLVSVGAKQVEMTIYRELKTAEYSAGKAEQCQGRRGSGCGHLSTRIGRCSLAVHKDQDLSWRKSLHRLTEGVDISTGILECSKCVVASNTQLPLPGCHHQEPLGCSAALFEILFHKPMKPPPRVSSPTSGLQTIGGIVPTDGAGGSADISAFDAFPLSPS